MINMMGAIIITFIKSASEKYGKYDCLVNLKINTIECIPKVNPIGSVNIIPVILYL
jgi:hypothetical protein